MTTKITFVDPSGFERSVTEEIGSVMEAAVLNGVDGILAECGGHAMCGTCHIYIDKEWLDRMPPILAAEDDMLNGTACPRRPDSRLACQLKVKAIPDGLRVYLPDSQL